MNTPLAMWLGFGVAVAALLYVDLGILNRHSHELSARRAAGWVAVWIFCAVLFDLVVWRALGTEKALLFATGYIVEYSLSMDNLFVFVLVFAYFKVETRHQPRILRWGILGAVVMRLIMIFAGVALLQAFKWTIYVFGLVLLYTAWKMISENENERVDPGQNPVLKLFRKFLPFSETADEDKFFTKKNGAWLATPLFATLIVIEASDVVFAVDSIPAILAISQDRFIVYTSNVFAILGLRALYFQLAAMLGVFKYLKYGISAILFFVGVKMLASAYYHIPTAASLCVVAFLLGISVAASLIFRDKQR